MSGIEAILQVIRQKLASPSAVRFIDPEILRRSLEDAWRQLLKALEEKRRLHWNEFFATGLSLRQKRGKHIGKTKRGKGTKPITVADGEGVPPGVLAESISPDECALIEKTVDTAAVPRSGGGRPCKNPGHLICDKAGDSDPMRERLANDDFTANRDFPIPLYHQIEEYLINQINTNRITPGSKISNERDLEEMFGVNRGTIRKAIANLVAKGYLKVVPRRGTYVVDQRENKTYKQTITVALASTRLDESIYINTAKRFMQRVHGVKVKFVSWNASQKWDVRKIYGNLFAHDVQALLSLNELIDSIPPIHEAFPEASAIFNLNGTQYGVPKMFSPMMLFYNIDIFNKKGVAYPDATWTWPDLLNAAEKLTDNQNGVYGFACYKNLYHLLPFIWQNEGDVMNPDMSSCVLADSNVIEALEFAKELDRISPFFKGHYKYSNVFKEITESFSENKLAMCYWGGTFPAWINDINPYLRLGVSPLPKMKTSASLITSEGYAISRDCSVPEIAWEFILELINPQSQREFLELGYDIVADKTQGVRRKRSQVYLPQMPVSRNIQYRYPEMLGILLNTLEIFGGNRQSVSAACSETSHLISKILKSRSIIEAISAY